MEGSTNLGDSHSAKASFRWNYNAVELLRDAKIRGKMKDSYYQLVKSEPIIQNFAGVRVFSEICSASENHISIPVGVNDLVGVKIIFRLSN